MLNSHLHGIVSAFLPLVSLTSSSDHLANTSIKAMIFTILRIMSRSHIRLAFFLSLSLLIYYIIAYELPSHHLLKRSERNENYYLNDEGTSNQGHTPNEADNARRERLRERFLLRISRSLRASREQDRSILQDQIFSRFNEAAAEATARRRRRERQTIDRRAGNSSRENAHVSVRFPRQLQPFLVNGQMPPGVPIPADYQDPIPATFEGRLASERDNRGNSYYTYEYEYAKELTGSDLSLDEWNRLVANRNPRAIRIREDFYKRASYIIRQVRKTFLENGYNQENTDPDQQEYAYARLMLNLYFDERIASINEYWQRLNDEDPRVMEAYYLFQQVYSDPWPNLGDISSEDEDDEDVV